MVTHSFFDKVVIKADSVVRILWGSPPSTGREMPGDAMKNDVLSDEEARESIGLMRINHCGEVCAQGLYYGQALTARDRDVRDKMWQCALEENDHLLWCEARLNDLGGRTSLLNPLWFAKSFVLGAVAGAFGDQWSLGFVVETENQVVRHLESHMLRLPEGDRKSRAVLEQMKVDEAEHASKALACGAAPLPLAVQRAMGLSSKVMTFSTYYI